MGKNTFKIKKKLFFLLIALIVWTILYILYCTFITKSESKRVIQKPDRMKMYQRDCQNWDPDLPVIYLVTPTYYRVVQKADLTRLSQMLMLLRNVHWILIEDSPYKTLRVQRLLLRSLLNYTHLNVATPLVYKKEDVAKGILQRNLGLTWLRKNRGYNDGVIYFADDDNTYDIQLFGEMRFTKEVSVWPVGHVGGLLVEMPIVNMTTGKITDFYSGWRGNRKFPIDMAGFAINLRYFLTKNVSFDCKIPEGYHETFILEQLNTKIDRLEPKAENCTRVLVWHTRTEIPFVNPPDQNTTLPPDFTIEV